MKPKMKMQLLTKWRRKKNIENSSNKFWLGKKNCCVLVTDKKCQKLQVALRNQFL